MGPFFIINPRGDAGHDPVAVVHAQRLLHGPESALDDGAARLEGGGCFVELVGACVDALHGAGVGAHEGPELAIVGKDAPVTDSDGAFASVHRAHLAPAFSIVFTHTKARLFGIGVFSPLIVAEGGVEFATVKA